MKTIINKNSGKWLYNTVLDFTENENEIEANVILTENFVIPFYNFKNKTFYEGATANEILESQIEVDLDLNQRISELENELHKIKSQL